MDKEISIAFLGALVPDESSFQNIAFRRSGIMVQSGIVKGLAALNIKHKIYSLRPVPSFPLYKKIFFKKENTQYTEQSTLILVPFINILFLKTLTSALYESFALLGWAINNLNKKRVILVYNTYTPPLPLVYLLGKITNSKVVAILYDLGMPPKQLKLNKTKKFIYRNVEFFAKLIIPRIDGRIVINENIANDYAPGKHYLLIDGGIGDDIIDRLFDLEIKKDLNKTIFLCAGSLWGANGVTLIVDALKSNTNPKIEMWFAGNGPDKDFIIKMAKLDNRIKYKGNLDLDELFELYKLADILMNIRVTDNCEGDYLFPSKILEYLTVGKYVITTKVAHIEKEYGKLCKVLSHNTSKELSATMEELTKISKIELINRGQFARNFMLEKHTWEKKSMKIIDYISNIV